MSGPQLEHLHGSVPYGTVIPSNEDGCQPASQLGPVTQSNPPDTRANSSAHFGNKPMGYDTQFKSGSYTDCGEGIRARRLYQCRKAELRIVWLGTFRV